MTWGSVAAHGVSFAALPASLRTLQRAGIPFSSALLLHPPTVLPILFNLTGPVMGSLRRIANCAKLPLVFHPLTTFQGTIPGSSIAARRALHSLPSIAASSGALDHKSVVHAVSTASSAEQAQPKSKKVKKAKKGSSAAKKVAGTSTDSQLGQNEAPEVSTGVSDEPPTSAAASDDHTTDVSNGVSTETTPDTPSSSTPREPSALARLCGKSVPDWLARRAEDLGYGTPTGVQTEALPLALQGRDCVLHAQTGSGKTLTYLLPVLAGIDPQRSAVQAIVVVPTRELGIQVSA